ncbi:MAG: hypothetical protein L3J28_15090 [Candidatus Polarisedimenticolaceae bacterium]|nr:hypothetical protein [Candidatus Polarisedimenticolaceae bacterium]
MKAVLVIVIFFVVGFFLLTHQEGDRLPDNIRYQALSYKKIDANHPQNAVFKIYKYRAAGEQLIVIYELDDDSALGLSNYLNKARLNFSNQGFEVTEYQQSSDFSGRKGAQYLFHSVFEYEGRPYPVLLIQPSQGEAVATLQALRSIEMLSNDE